MTLLDALSWVLIIALLAATPLACWMDWMYRAVDFDLWGIVGILCLGTAITTILAGIIPVVFYAPGIIITIVWFCLMKLDWIQGADFMYLMLISLFFVYNPISGHVIEVIPFTIFLIACLVVSGILVMTGALVTGRSMWFQLRKRFPMILPIAAALVLTVVLG